MPLVFAKEKKKNINNNEKKINFNNDEDSKDYIKLFEESFNKLNINFVDSINESEIIKSGIKGMLKNLDPYTKLLEGSSLDSYDVLPEDLRKTLKTMREKSLENTEKRLQTLKKYK